MNGKSPQAFGNLTIYGRNPVLEILQDDSIQVLRLHLARSNRNSDEIRRLKNLAEQRGVPVSLHSKLELSRISRNSRQDQGVAADLSCPSLGDANQLSQQPLARRLIALDRINNPQNLGMAIRSVAASSCDGLIVSREKGNTRLSPLVVKASAGTFFKAPIYRCDQLSPTLRQLQVAGYSVITLSADGGRPLFETPLPAHSIFVLGNESDGISAAIEELADLRVAIPMQRGVESLNVAVTAALIAFLGDSSGR